MLIAPAVSMRGHDPAEEPKAVSNAIQKNAIRTSRKQSPINGATRLRAVFATFETVVLSIVVIVIAVGFSSSAFALAQPGPLTTSVAVPSAPIHDLAAFVWKRSDLFDGRRGASALAVATDPRDGWIAVGGEQGLLVALPGDGAAPLRVSLPAVHDLSFGASGELYVATMQGLWVLPRQGDGFATQPFEATPANGELARAARRVATGHGLIAVATDAGAYVARVLGHERTDGAHLEWRQLKANFPAGPVRAIGIHEEDGRVEVWAVVGNALWRAGYAEPHEPMDVFEEAVPERVHADAPVDLVTGLPGGAVALVYPAVIHLRARNTVTRKFQWRLYRPIVPPGAVIERFGFGVDQYWLATDRGLVSSQSVVGPWRRAGPPAGRAAAYAMAALGARLYVASAGGLLVAERTRGGRAAREQVFSPTVPSVSVVHRKALREQGLQARVIHDAWRGVRRRAWLPVLGLRLDADRDRGRGSDLDEVVVSGEYHELRDSDRNRSRDLGASITMTWDLRDTAYEPEQIDLSREARLVIGLRDDVLDEVNQIYFERLSVDAQLATPARRGSGGDENEAQAHRFSLELRRGQLDAALDAWTGGWWSQQLENTAIPRD